MTLSDNSKSILLIGRDVGPVAKVLKKNSAKVKIGTVDVLGNLETRKYSDWSFSVERQIANSPINRNKQRSVMELIEELTLIIMEEHDFDLFIPLSFLHEAPNFINKISNKINSKSIDKEIFEIASSSHAFLSRISQFRSEIIRKTDFILPNLANSSFEHEIIITSPKDRTEKFNIKPQHEKTQKFYLPQVPVYCVALIRIEEQCNYIGIQKVIPPLNKNFIVNDFSKNGLVPIAEIPGISNTTSLIEVFRNLVLQLNLSGIITFFFSIKNSMLVFYQCKLLPDENFDLWNNQSQNLIWKLLLNEEFNFKSHLKRNLYSFKIPVYSLEPIPVPEIDSSIATQRNIPNVISSPEYPVCSIFGHQNTVVAAIRELKRTKRRIQHLLGSVEE